MGNMDAFLDRMNSNKLSGIGSNIIRNGSYANIQNQNLMENSRQRQGNTPNLQYLPHSMSKESLMEYQPIQS